MRFTSDIFSARRAKLRHLLTAEHRLTDDIVLLLGNVDAPMNYRDNVYPFWQDATFRYFFGADFPGLAGLIDLADETDGLFGDEPGLEEMIWLGEHPSLSSFAEHAGVTKSGPLASLERYLAEQIARGRHVHFLPIYRGDNLLRLGQLVRRSDFALATQWSPALVQAVVQLREIKTAEEIDEIEDAVAVSAMMHQAAFEATRPGIRERDVVARMEFVLRSRDTHFAYPPIFTKRGEILHAQGHGNLLEHGDLVVNDSGANSPTGYASDITRTIPVSGRFSDLQRKIYQTVLEAQTAAIAMVKPGILFAEVHRLAAQHLVEGLAELGIFNGCPADIVDSGAYAICFQCGLGHQIGLEVHDMESLGEDYVGYDNTTQRSAMFGFDRLRLGKALKPGMTLTVEPGIYFIPKLIEQWSAEKRYEAFINYERLGDFSGFGGIRIEDDILVTDTGSRVLGPPIPKAVEEVEAIVGGA